VQLKFFNKQINSNIGKFYNISKIFKFKKNNTNINYGTKEMTYDKLPNHSLVIQN
jgi:hypothetical protein